MPPLNKPIRRRLDLFKIHAHVNGVAVPDYANLFGLIPACASRIRELHERVIALPEFAIERGLARFVAYEGDLGIKPLIFDIQSEQQRVGDLEPGEVVANRTHGIIDPVSHYAVIEYHQRGAKASQIAWLLESILRQTPGMDSLSLQSTPVAGEAFLRELARFDRVRVANVTMSQPNNSWNDAEDALMRVGSESDARTVSVEVVAHREGTVSRTRGILHYVVNQIRRNVHSFKNVVVKGQKRGLLGEETLNLHKYAKHCRVELPRGVDGQPDSTALFDKIEEYLKDSIQNP